MKKLNDMVSYYDLLTFLKEGVHFNKVCVHKFGKEIFYIYDSNNYILENKSLEGLQFSMFLSECENDNTKFIKNIEIIKK